MTALVALCACGGGGNAAGVAATVPVVTPPAPPAPPSSALPAGGKPDGWKLVWADEFDKDGLPDATKWAYDTEFNRNGWFNHELQYYAAGRLENSRVENGKLIITARKE
eukprot:gene18102-17952_t